MHLISNKTYFGALEPIGQLLRATSHMRLNACDHCTSSTLSLSLVEKVELLQVRFTLRLRDQQSMWMQGGCKVYMDSYLALNGSCFVIAWIIFKNRFLLVGRPNTKRGDQGTPNAHNHWFALFYHVWGTAWLKIHWNSIWLRARSQMTSHYTGGPWPHYMILEVSWDTFFGLSQFHGHGSWLVCEVALSH